jgi:periplasmic divalent cation tolerance protein
MTITHEQDDARLVYVTCPDTEIAQSIARALVDNREAACVNIVPGLQSVYRWQGTIETDAEVLLLIKTRRACLEAIQTRLDALHPDDVPELVAVTIREGAQDYLNWLTKQTTRV